LQIFFPFFLKIQNIDIFIQIFVDFLKVFPWFAPVWFYVSTFTGFMLPFYWDKAKKQGGLEKEDSIFFS